MTNFSLNCVFSKKNISIDASSNYQKYYNHNTLVEDHKCRNEHLNGFTSETKQTGIVCQLLSLCVLTSTWICQQTENKYTKSISMENKNPTYEFIKDDAFIVRFSLWNISLSLQKLLGDSSLKSTCF